MKVQKRIESIMPLLQRLGSKVLEYAKLEYFRDIKATQLSCLIPDACRKYMLRSRRTDSRDK